jgi:soluble lytic murein transglycosylase
MSARSKRILTVALIIVGAILLGIIVDLIWGVIEKKTHPDNYSEYIRKYSEEFNVPEHVIYAVIKVESDFDPNATSSAGAIGLMQMVNGTFGDVKGYLGETTTTFHDLYEPETSIRYGTCYLNYLYKMFDYNWDTALAAYNGGLGNVSKWLNDERYSDDGENLKDIPFAETKNYVRKVNDAMDTYKKIYYKGNEVQT